MGWVTMSERDLQRIEVLAKVTAGRRTVVAAAAVLALSVRQVHRLLRSYRRGGAAAIVHQARGRPSNNRIRDDARAEAMELVRRRLVTSLSTWLRCRSRSLIVTQPKPALPAHVHGQGDGHSCFAQWDILALRLHHLIM